MLFAVAKVDQMFKEEYIQQGETRRGDHDVEKCLGRMLLRMRASFSCQIIYRGIQWSLGSRKKKYHDLSLVGKLKMQTKAWMIPLEVYGITWTNMGELKNELGQVIRNKPSNNKDPDIFC